MQSTAHAVAEPIAENQPAVSPVADAVSEHPVRKPEIQPEPANIATLQIKPAPKRQARDELNWSETAFELKLDGIARQFAINSIVKSWGEGRLHLVFLPELDVMLKPELERQIKQAIEQQLGVSLNLELSSQTVLEVETPSEASARKQEEERQHVIRAIEQDELVQQLKSLLDVELVEDSVKKIDG